MSFEKTVKELEVIIHRAYAEGVTMQEAERLAARTLTVRLEISEQLKVADLDARMKKHGVKAVRAAAYLEEVAKHEKKPAEGMLDHVVNMQNSVAKEERIFAESEVERDLYQNYLEIFKDAHLYFRSIMKGTFGE
jgi:hypothetical protein